MQASERPEQSPTSTIRLLTSAEAAQEDRVCWLSRTPAERLAAAEQLRQSIYGYDPATARIQAIAELIERPRR